MTVTRRRAPVIRFRLFVADGAENSVRAIANLRALCVENWPGRHSIEVLDVFKEPARALAEGILMTPTLIRVFPLPPRRIVGTLGNAQSVLEGLGLESPEQAA